MTRELFCHICSSEIKREHGRFERHTRWWPSHSTHVVNGVSVCDDHFAPEILRCAGNPILGNVLDRRETVPTTRGLLDHDGFRQGFDLVTVARAAALKDRRDLYRETLIRLAAFAVSAVESLDRRAA